MKFIQAVNHAQCVLRLFIGQDPIRFFFAGTKEDAAAIDFDDKLIYEEIAKPIGERKIFTQQILREEALEAFKKWSESPNKIEY